MKQEHIRAAIQWNWEMLGKTLEASTKRDDKVLTMEEDKQAKHYAANIKRSNEILESMT